MTGDKKQNDRDGSKKATAPTTTTPTTATSTSTPNRTTNTTFLADNADPTIRNKPGSGVA